MPIAATYVHTNLIARDWRSLAAFYEAVFGCIPIPPARDLRGDWLDAATGAAGAHISGLHLRLPGFGADGPTLELMQYEPALERTAPGLNRPGFGHIAFAVEDVAQARRAVLAAGGSAVGGIVSWTIAGARSAEWTYLRDPEGNVIELQRRAANQGADPV